MSTRSFDNGSINLQIAGLFKNVDQTVAAATMTLQETFTATLTNGTGPDQADRLYYARRSVSSGSPDDIDLASGALTDIFGSALNFTRIKGIYIRNRSTTSNEILQVGGGSNSLVNWVGAAGDVVNVRPGGCMFLFAPDATAYVVTGGTADVLRVTAAAGSPSYDIVIIGASA